MSLNGLTNSRRSHRLVTLLIALGLLTACASPQPIKPLANINQRSTAPATIIANVVESKGGVLKDEALDPAIIDWTGTLASDQGWLFAQSELEALDKATVNDSTRNYAASQLSWLSGDLSRSQELLEQIQVTDRRSVALTLRERQRREAISGNFIAAAKLALSRHNGELGDLASSSTENYELLSNASQSQLETANRLAAPESDWHGWLSLNLAYRQGKPAVLSWLQNNRNHPANDLELPAGISSWLADTAPSRIAVLLPLSGRLKSASEEALNGVIQGIYWRYRSAAQRPDVVTIDTELTSNGAEAYQLAVESGADFVIGPLLKSRVSDIASLPRLPVPVLALNRIEATSPYQQRQPLLSISLSPEDEAVQIAELAWGKGLRTPLIIADQGAWGTRMTDAVSQTWRQLGGAAPQATTLNPDNEDNKTVAEHTGTGTSIARIQAMERAFDAPVDAQPRKREDIDSIFILVESAEKARELRPLLKFNYAGNLPVFAPSSVFQDQSNTKNRDLDGVNFVLSPGMREPGNPSSSLFLLGLDAAKFVGHFNQALSTSATVMHGDTGSLSHDLRGNVMRRLSPVVFARGRVQAQR